jgi:transcriptional regulator with XRE-family HTH domain
VIFVIATTGDAMQVQKLRIQHGWTQQQLADLSGLNIRTVQRIENGASASVESLKSLAAVFEVEFSTLKEPPTMNTATTISTAPANQGEAMSHDEFLAYRQVRKLKGWYIHLAQYAVVIPFLFAINYLTKPDKFWAVWPALGWGLGLALHGLMISPWLARNSVDWEAQQVQKYLKR